MCLILFDFFSIRKIFRKLRSLFFSTNRIYRGDILNRKVLKAVKNILYILFVLILIFFIVINIRGRGNKNYIPGIGSYKIMTVLSGSMKPVFNPGDVIVGKEVNADRIKIGDVITFKYNNSLTTHRVINTTNKEGHLFFITKGDNNNIGDMNPVNSDFVVSKYLFRIPLIGFFIAFFKGVPGIITIWIVIILVIGKDLYKNFKKKNTA
jgi:signal peptidase